MSLFALDLTFLFLALSILVGHGTFGSVTNDWFKMGCSIENNASRWNMSSVEE